MLQGSPSFGFRQFIARVKILAALVFPTPREPANKKACAPTVHAVTNPQSQTPKGAASV